MALSFEMHFHTGHIHILSIPHNIANKVTCIIKLYGEETETLESHEYGSLNFSFGALLLKNIYLKIPKYFK